MTEEKAIALFKCLADRSRLQILKSLMEEDMYVERLAERLALTPATISFHLRKLEASGAVKSRKEQYYTIYSVEKDVFRLNLLDVVMEKSTEMDEQLQREQQYRQKVLDTFFVYGKLVSIPAQRKKKRICLEKIAEDFEISRVYEEKEVNELILRYHEDYCTIRRDMIAEGIFKREGTLYTRME